MTESGQGSGDHAAPQAGAPWGPDPAEPAYGHVVGPGYEGPGEAHGYGYPPLPEAVTQYIPPVPAAPGQGEAATQYIPPVPAAPGQGEAATQYIPPVPASPGHHEAATQYIPPVPASAGQDEAATQYIPPVPAPPGHHEAATQYIPPVPASAGQDEAATQYIPPVPAAPDAFDGLFRDSGAAAQGHTQQLPPVQEPVLRQPPPRAYPPRAQRPVPPPPQQFQPHPQYAPPAPPPPPEAGRRVSPVVVGAVVIGLAVVGLGVGALLSDGKARNNDPGAVGAVPSAGSSTAAGGGEAPVDPARSQAVQLDKLLADSNDSRAAVIRAVDDIKGCRNLGQAANDLRDAARQREQLVTRLQDLKIDQLPDNAKLADSLTKAWQASADADNSYAAWADDVSGEKKGCKDGQAKSTGNAAQGNKSSGEATKAKESAATLWNAIAAKYNLTKRDKSQL
ncbi:hypothetical protein AB0B01_08650 [Streptomyces sp. NPDC044571]|uniref:hypothetical protein n=1 Tax=Streptomyces sp. NPDC044571 TaxID=3155371 RepID=UPI0033F099AC